VEWTIFPQSINQIDWFLSFNLRGDIRHHGLNSNYNLEYLNICPSRTCGGWGDRIDAGDGLVDVVEEEVVCGGVPSIGGEDVDVLIGRGER
jgi:hypothetical protein